MASTSQDIMQRSKTIALKRIQSHVIPSLHAIREGMVWLIPCLLMSSFALLFASLGDFILDERPAWVEQMYSLHRNLSLFFPYLMTATISYVLAIQWRLPRPPIVLLMSLNLVVAVSVLPTDATTAVFSIVLALLTPLYAVPCLAFFCRFKQLKLTRSSSAGHNVMESLNLVGPAIITSLIVMVISYGFVSSTLSVSFDWLLSFNPTETPTTFGAIFAALNSILWFFGVHGYYALLPLVDMLQEASNLNYSTTLAGGEAFYPMNLSLMGAFVFIGGSGATLSLALALLFFSSRKELRLIALTSLPIGLLNINEILLFGLPIILNPRLFLPFVLVPICNVVTTMSAINLGWLPVPSNVVPFNSPILLNAWIATDGNWSAPLVQLFNVGLGILIYLPTVKHISNTTGHSIVLANLDTKYSRKQEEARNTIDDTVSQVFELRRQNRQVEDQLLLMSQYEFCLEYQPQICPLTNKLVGCEALIRAKGQSGQPLSPGEFLPWLEKAKLMGDVDIWVVKQVITDIKRFRAVGLTIPVSVNITPDTLFNEQSLNKLVETIGDFGPYIHVEITENSLIVDHQKLTYILNKLHQLGVHIHIDDFGTGYSSLSYLNKFDIDVIKIDRDFVLALSSDKGKEVFDSMISLATKLDLGIIVEGVETTEQLSTIPKSERIWVQGWYYAKSMPLDAFITFAKPDLTQTQEHDEALP
jgi:lactose/cellobiose-specific phosphotransferase system IIC component